jgi:AcrR family transcriptional regulator
MQGTRRALNVSARKERAERILDAAASLILRHGYRRITIEDVAKETGIGKGTIYLHWRSREELFQSALQREAGFLFQDLLEALHRDPELALAPRLLPEIFRRVVDRPLLYALFTADSEILGSLVDDDVAQSTQQGLTPDDNYLRLLADHGLLGDHLTVPEALYLVGAVSRGFLASGRLRDGGELTLDHMAQLFGTTIRRALGGDPHPSPQTVQSLATEVIRLFTKIVKINQDRLKQHYQ